jgi:hypothetical protein
MANNRPEEARRVLCRYHGGSEHPNELVRAELEEIAEALEAERSQQTASYMHFIRTRKSPGFILRGMKLTDRQSCQPPPALDMFLPWLHHSMVWQWPCFVLPSTGLE